MVGRCFGHRQRPFCVMEEVEHRSIVEEGVGYEAANPVAPGDPGKEGEQFRADAVTLVSILDDECDFGGVTAGQAVVAADSDDPAVQRGHERGLAFWIETGEPPDVVVEQFRMDAKEPLSYGVRREPAMEGA